MRIALCLDYYFYAKRMQAFCIKAIRQLRDGFYFWKMDLIFATNNLNKIAEVKKALTAIDIKGLKEAGIDVDIPETGSTLKENALLKSSFIYENYGFNCFSDDTGLEVDALDGAPGVYSARYSGEGATPEKNNAKLLAALENHTDTTARFKTVISLIIDGEKHFFEGVCEGEIVPHCGVDGFGYDPVFQPKGYNVTFAEMSVEQKNEISHRGLAVKKLVTFLNGLG